MARYKFSHVHFVCSTISIVHTCSKLIWTLEQALNTAVKGFTKYLKVWSTAVHIPAHLEFLSTQLYVREVRTLAYEHSDGLKI
jgi:hypothetical protein